MTTLLDFEKKNKHSPLAGKFGDGELPSSQCVWAAAEIGKKRGKYAN